MISTSEIKTSVVGDENKWSSRCACCITNLDKEPVTERMKP